MSTTSTDVVPVVLISTDVKLKQAIDVFVGSRVVIVNEMEAILRRENCSEDGLSRGAFSLCGQTCKKLTNGLSLLFKILLSARNIGVSVDIAYKI